MTHAGLTKPAFRYAVAVLALGLLSAAPAYAEGLNYQVFCHIYPKGINRRGCLHNWRMIKEKTMSLNKCIAFGVVLLLTLAALAPAEAAGTPSQAQAMAAKKALMNFQLTESNFNKILAFSAEVDRKPCKLSIVALHGKMPKAKTMDQAAAIYDAQPGVHAALARHGLSARTYLLGSTVLSYAAAQDMRRQMAEKHPKMAQEMDSGDYPVSAANVAFYHQHKAQFVKSRMQSGRAALKRNHGKLPACLRGKQTQR